MHKIYVSTVVIIIKIKINYYYKIKKNLDLRPQRPNINLNFKVSENKILTFNTKLLLLPNY